MIVRSYDAKTPRLGARVFVAENAALIGDVELGDDCSVWFSTTIRGDVNANTTLLNEMSMGKFMVNYSGHGTAGSWGGNPVFFNVFSVSLQAEHQPAIYTMLTCLNGYYHWLYNPSMAEVLVNTQSKGAVAAWGSSGLTTPNVQEEMARQFYLKTGDGTIPRLGDLVRDAKTALTGQFESPDVRLSWALIGDPMLKVR